MSYINAFHSINDRTVTVWERVGDQRITKVYDAPYYFYVEPAGLREITQFENEGERKFVRVDSNHVKTLNGQIAHKVTCSDRWTMENQIGICRKNNLTTYESDIPPESRVLSENYYKCEVPDLNIMFLDIEVDYNERIGFAGVSNPYAPINSVAYHCTSDKKTKLIAVPPPEWDGVLDETLRNIADITLVDSEYELLRLLMIDVQLCDGLCGWNSDFFDVPYIAKRLETLHTDRGHFPPKPANMLCFPKSADARYRDIEVYGRSQIICDLSGRLRMDYMVLFQKFEMAKRPSYKLANISNEILPELPKLEYEGSLANLYRTDFNFFMRYNIRDVECMLGFERKLGYAQLANIMYHESTGFFANINGTIRLAEYSIINYCHYVLGCIVPDGPGAAQQRTYGPTFDDNGEEVDKKAEGAFVLEPQVGMHEWIGSIDVNSLYPSSIRSVNISPERLIGQFHGCVEDFEEIAKGTTAQLSLVMEDNGQALVHTAAQWREILKDNNWSVSGYGTVFDQSSQGVIPAILSDWYDTRKAYQKLKNKAKEAGDKDKVSYYDKMQYCYKIKLNSLYGALLNSFFRFYDPRLGESTTGTGRAILRFMCSRTNEILTDSFEIGHAVLYGDTDSVYFRTYASNKEDAINVADGVAEIVNGSFKKFMQDAFLCGEGFDDIIAAGREVVASRGIFVTPKRYVLKVINLDGDDCNKLKVMGLDTKKTILPPYVQKELNTFLERLLDGDDWDIIADDVVALKDKMKYELDLVELGLPKGCNNVEKYTVDCNNNVNSRIPGHVRAAIYYNRLLTKNQDTKSIKITSGMRVNVFYLQVPDGKFKSIAVPVDIEEVPDWFYETVEINKNMQLQRLIDNPLKNVLKAIGKEPPTHQSVFISKTLEF